MKRYENPNIDFIGITECDIITTSIQYDNYYDISDTPAVDVTSNSDNGVGGVAGN